jgi:hypothetical protein
MINPDDAVKASAARIMLLRGPDMRMARSHDCRQRDCMPMCEQDLVNAGLLQRKIIDGSVYVCIYQQVHVCTADRCTGYIGRQDGVCPATGLYHGQVDPERSYIQPEKRMARFRPGISVLKRAIAVAPDPLTVEEQQTFFHAHGSSSVKYRAVDAGDDDDDASAAMVSVKIEPGPSDTGGPLVAEGYDDDGNDTLPESGFYSFGSTVVKGASRGTKRGGKKAKGRRMYAATSRPAGSLPGGSGGGGRKKPVDASKRRDDAEMIVTQLLYSNVRKTINQEKKARLADEKLKALTSYYKERAGITFPIMVEVEGIKALYDVDNPELSNLKRDDQRVAYYVNIIMRTWDIVTSSPWGADNPGYKFWAHALSVLYKMRAGMKLQGLQLLPFDSYLYGLPNRGDLVRYNESYSSSIVTEGMKHIRAAYESALADGWSPNALSVDAL